MHNGEPLYGMLTPEMARLYEGIFLERREHNRRGHKPRQTMSEACNHYHRPRPPRHRPRPDSPGRQH
jgi:hypothetical protein